VPQSYKRDKCNWLYRLRLELIRHKLRRDALRISHIFDTALFTLVSQLGQLFQPEDGLRFLQIRIMTDFQMWRSQLHN